MLSRNAKGHNTKVIFENKSHNSQGQLGDGPDAERRTKVLDHHEDSVGTHIVTMMGCRCL